MKVKEFKKEQMLFPNCSEYVTRIRLTKEEFKEAKKIAKMFNFDKKELKYFEDHLKNGEDQPLISFGEFIEEKYAQPYEFIRDIILEQRKKKKLK